MYTCHTHLLFICRIAFRHTSLCVCIIVNVFDTLVIAVSVNVVIIVIIHIIITIITVITILIGLECVCVPLCLTRWHSMTLRRTSTYLNKLTTTATVDTTITRVLINFVLIIIITVISMLTIHCIVHNIVIIVLRGY